MKKAALFATIIAATLATGSAAYAGSAHITVPDPAHVVNKILHLVAHRHNGPAVRYIHYRGHRPYWHRPYWRHGRFHRGHRHFRGRGRRDGHGGWDRNDRDRNLAPRHDGRRGRR